MTIYYYDLTTKSFGRLLKEDLQSNYELGHMNPSTTIECKAATHLLWVVKRITQMPPSYSLMPNQFKKLHVHQVIQDECPEIFADEFEHLCDVNHDDDMWREYE